MFDLILLIIGKKEQSSVKEKYGLCKLSDITFL